MSDSGQPGAGSSIASEPGFAGRVLRSFLYSGVGNLIGQVLAAAGTLIGIALLTKAEYGAASFALGVLYVVRAFTEAGLGVALVQARKTSREQLDSLFWLSLLITGGSYGLIFLAAPLVEVFFPTITDGPDLVRGICFSVALYTFYFVPRAFMERDLQFGRLVIIDNVSIIAATGVLFWAAKSGHGAWSFVYFEISQRGLQAVLSFAVRPFLPRLHLKFSEIRDMFSFAVYATGSRILYNLYNHADFFIVPLFFSEAALGAYSAARNLVIIPVRGLATIINKVAYPAFARLQDDLPRLRQYVFNINEAALALIGPVLGLVAIYAGPTIRAVDSLSKYADAVPYIWLFAILGVFRAVAPLIPQLLNAVGQSRLSFLYSLACALVLPASFYVGAHFGLIGVVLAWVLAYPLVVMVLFYFGALVLDLRPTDMLRLFAGLRIAVPAFAIEIGIHVLLSRALELGDGPTAAIGAPLSLLLAGLWVYTSQRHRLADLRSGGRPSPPRADSEQGETSRS